MYVFLFIIGVNEPFAHDLALRKAGQVELSGRRLNNLARHDIAKLTGTLSTQFLGGRRLVFALHTAIKTYKDVTL